MGNLVTLQKIYVKFRAEMPRFGVRVTKSTPPNRGAKYEKHAKFGAEMAFLSVFSIF
jgi:hypothetical protein